MGLSADDRSEPRKIIGHVREIAGARLGNAIKSAVDARSLGADGHEATAGLQLFAGCGVLEA